MEDRSRRPSRRGFLSKALAAAAALGLEAFEAYKHDRMTMEFWQDVERDLWIE